MKYLLLLTTCTVSLVMHNSLPILGLTKPDKIKKAFFTPTKYERNNLVNYKYLENGKNTNELSPVNYLLDLKGTEFKYAGNINEIFFYTIGNNKKPYENPYSTQIIVKSIEPMTTVGELNESSQKMIKQYEKSGMKVIISTSKELLINGNNAIETRLTIKVESRTCQTYQLVTSNKNYGIMFIGNSFERQNELFNQIEKIGHSLTIK